MCKPLLDIHCIEKPYCKYPVAIRVTMMDGTVQTYNLETKTEYRFLDRLRMNLTQGYPQKKRRCRPHRSQL